MSIVFFFGLLAAAALAWYGAEPFIVCITSRGEQVIENPQWVKRGFALFGCATVANIVAPLGGWFGLMLSAATNLSLFVGIPAAIFLSKVAVKGAQARSERAAIDEQRAAETAEQKRIETMKASGPVIDIARGTGRLAARGHGSPILADESVLIDTDAAYGGTVVIGPMGSGKSRAVLQPWVGHWLTTDKSAGMFAYGVKPNWSSILERIAVYADRTPEQIHVVGPGHLPWPLLIGLEPDNVANFMSEAFRRNGGNSSGQVWEDQAVNIARRICAMLYYATGGGKGRRLIADTCTPDGEVIRARTLGYDLASVSEIVHARDEHLAAIISAMRGRVAELAASNREASEDLENAMSGFSRLTDKVPEKQRAGYDSQIDSVIEVFDANRELRKAFCSDQDFDLQGALANGGCVILDIDLGQYAAAGRLVYLLAFEQMRRLMLGRIKQIDAGERVDPVAFIADEYAEVAVQAHKSLWRLCREAKIAPVIAYQLHSDLRSVVGGGDAADALVVGMRTKIMFSTDDKASVDLVGGALGSVRNTYETYAYNRGSNSGSNFGSNHGPQGGGSSGSSSGSSEGESWSQSLQQDQIVDAQVVQSLSNRIRRDVPLDQQVAEAILIGELRGKRVADIVLLRAWDPPALPSPAKDEVISGEPFSGVGMTCADAWGGSGGI